MAYFGRKPDKPQTTPGSGSGFVQQEAGRRAVRLVRRLLAADRPERPVNPGRASRAARSDRSGRSAR